MPTQNPKAPSPRKFRIAISPGWINHPTSAAAAWAVNPTTHIL